jgi:hypothetical protein
MELDAAVAGAARAISALARDRNRVRDSLLAVAGTRIVLQSVQPLNWCGFDPQNLLTTVGEQLLHMRFLQLCAGRDRAAEFARPVVEERITGTWHVVATDSVRLSASGQRVALPQAGEAVVMEEVEIVADGVSLRARRALLIGGRDGTLQVVLL